VSGVGFNSWSGAFDILGYELHDTGLALVAILDGFWVHNMLVVCWYVVLFCHVLLELIEKLLMVWTYITK
jgi:hypothetical protein